MIGRLKERWRRRGTLLRPRRLAVKLHEAVFRTCARHDLAGIAAVLFFLTLREGERAVPVTSPRPLKILAMPRVVFTEEVLASFGSDGRFRVYQPHSMGIKGMAHGILPATLDDNFYVSDDQDVEHCKARYRRFLDRMWGHLERLVHIDAVVSGNFGYYAERELATVLEARGVAFVAMHKENLKSPGRLEFSRSIYRDRRGPFTGRKILVYNEAERELQISAGVARREQILVCGMPRLDRMHQWRRAQARCGTAPVRRPRVLLFSFTPKAVLPRIGRRPAGGFKNNEERLEDEAQTLSWEHLARNTHEAVRRLAETYPEVDVVVKSKVRAREHREMLRLFGKPSALPENLELVVGGDPADLITGSDVVCGFNTTAVIEALAAGKPVVVPRFAEALEGHMRPYIVDYGDAVRYADSPEELMELLRVETLARRAPPAELEPARLQVLERWAGNADGRSGERVCAQVLAEIERAPAAAASELSG